MRIILKKYKFYTIYKSNCINFYPRLLVDVLVIVELIALSSKKWRHFHQIQLPIKIPINFASCQVLGEVYKLDNLIALPFSGRLTIPSLDDTN